MTRASIVSYWDQSTTSHHRGISLVHKSDCTDALDHQQLTRNNTVHCILQYILLNFHVKHLFFMISEFPVYKSKRSEQLKVSSKLF